MASSRRMTPAQVGRQTEWSQPPVEEEPRNTRLQKSEEIFSRHDVGRRRDISEITQKHLEQVISAMIPSSTGSSLDPIESTPMNSMVTQPSYREAEEAQFKQTSKDSEKQMIVNNYYISDKDNGWKQLKEGEILPNMSGNSTQGILSKISTDKSQEETANK